mmetsp:Transcript_10649/g.44031  ORF Transcript_10649/g.44031 Transcript_10649/m.44031 type:complete len:268 (+) Transcript_10649:279-1082(+)
MDSTLTAPCPPVTFLLRLRRNVERSRFGSQRSGSGGGPGLAGSKPLGRRRRRLRSFRRSDMTLRLRGCSASPLHPALSPPSRAVDPTLPASALSRTGAESSASGLSFSAPGTGARPEASSSAAPTCPELARHSTAPARASRASVSSPSSPRAARASQRCQSSAASACLPSTCRRSAAPRSSSAGRAMSPPPPPGESARSSVAAERSASSSLPYTSRRVATTGGVNLISSATASSAAAASSSSPARAASSARAQWAAAAAAGPRWPPA